MKEEKLEEKMQTYASAGVDIAQADRFVDRLKNMARRSGHEQMWKAAGGYAAVYPALGDTSRGIAVTTDGVGTKLLVAHKLKKYDTIGIDLVAMCANDLICVGATPNIFLDYFAVGKLDQSADAIMQGIVTGCDQTGMLLVGGETAEMPGVYEKGHFDLAGFAVGQVQKKDLLTGERVAAGQTLVGIASSGIHSNGLSLARKVLPDDDETYLALLEPTLLYVKVMLAALAQFGPQITGMANITGGGWTNLFRLNDKVGFNIDKPLTVPPILQKITTVAEIAEIEMYKTFNMGMGMAVMVDGDATPLINLITNHGFKAQIVGVVTDQAGTLNTISLATKSLTIKAEH